MLTFGPPHKHLLSFGSSLPLKSHLASFPNYLSIFTPSPLDHFFSISTQISFKNRTPLLHCLSLFILFLENSNHLYTLVTNFDLNYLKFDAIQLMTLWFERNNYAPDMPQISLQQRC